MGVHNSRRTADEGNDPNPNSFTIQYENSRSGDYAVHRHYPGCDATTAMQLFQTAYKRLLDKAAFRTADPLRF